MKLIFCIMFLLFSLNSFALIKIKENLLLDFMTIYESVRIKQGNNIKQEDWDKYLIWGIDEIMNLTDSITYGEALNNLIYPVSKYALISKNKYDKSIKTGKYYLEQSGPKIFSDYNFLMSIFSPYKTELKKKRKKSIEDIEVIILNNNYYFKYSKLGEKNKNFYNKNQEIKAIKISHSTEDVKKSSYKIASLMKTWMTYQYFYPQFNELEITTKELLLFINKAIKIDEIKSYYILFDEFLSIFKDGHSLIVNSFGNSSIIKRYIASYQMPFDVQINKTVKIIKNQSSHNIEGYEIINLDNQNISDYLNNVKKRVSASTKQEFKLNLERKFTFLLKKDSIKLTLKRDNKYITVFVKPIIYKKTILDSLEIKLIKSLENSNILYVDLDASSFKYKEFKKKLTHHNSKQNILFDMRTRPSYAFNKVLSNFITSKVQSDNFCIKTIDPYIPDSIYSCEFNTIKPKRKNFDKKIFFLINENVYSYGETCVSYIKNSKRATLLGQNTRGTNGNSIRVSLPIMGFFMTGMKTITKDGKDIWYDGYSPDIYLSETNLLQESIDYISAMTNN